MQNLDSDVREAFLGTLCSSWRVRKATLERVFVEDAQFWHLFHNVRGLKNIHGIYQLWGSTNYPPLKIDFIRIIADEKHNVLLVDLIEHCNLYPMPPWTFFGGPTMRLHVILGLTDTPQGKKITYQEDHSMWLESLLFHTLPAPVGTFLEKHAMPFFGSVIASLGNSLYQSQTGSAPKEVDFQRANGTGGGSGLRDLDRDLERAVNAIFNGSPAQRRTAIDRLYSKDAVVWNAMYIVRGRSAIFGAVNLWCTLNEISVKINRLVPCGDLVAIDAAQQFRPHWWPQFLPAFVQWNHIILTLADGPHGGKVIVRHENHPLGTEATLIYNLGPLSWSINKLRRGMGVLFGTAGRAIYAGLEVQSSQSGLLDQPHEFTPPSHGQQRSLNGSAPIRA